MYIQLSHACIIQACEHTVLVHYYSLVQTSRLNSQSIIFLNVFYY